MSASSVDQLWACDKGAGVPQQRHAHLREGSVFMVVGGSETQRTIVGASRSNADTAVRRPAASLDVPHVRECLHPLITLQGCLRLLLETLPRTSASRMSMLPLAPSTMPQLASTCGQAAGGSGPVAAEAAAAAAAAGAAAAAAAAAAPLTSCGSAKCQPAQGPVCAARAENTVPPQHDAQRAGVLWEAQSGFGVQGGQAGSRRRARQ
jgi:hypothetical protein